MAKVNNVVHIKFEVFIFSFYFFGYRKSHGLTSTSTVMYFLLPVQERDDDEEEIHCR